MKSTDLMTAYQQQNDARKQAEQDEANTVKHEMATQTNTQSAII